jgi:hypothetical protein
MSIDIFFQDLPAGIDDAMEIPSDFLPGPIGSRAAVVEAITAAAPVDFRDPNWGRLDGNGYSIEVSLGPEDPVLSFAFHVRGPDLREVDLIVADILAGLGIRALDGRREAVIVDADMLLHPDPEASAAWLTLLDRVGIDRPEAD